MQLGRLGIAALLLSTAAWGQPSPADALADRLESARTDPDRAAILAEQPALRAEILKIVTARAAAAFGKNQWDAALADYYAMFAIANANGDQKEIARVGRFIGRCYSRKNQLTTAADFLEKSLALAARMGDKENIAEAHGQLVTVYLFLGRLEEGEQSGRKARAGFLELGNKRNAIASTINLSTVVGEKGDQIQKAALLREAIRECEEAGFEDYLARAVNNLAVVYHDQGEYERSVQYLQRSTELLVKSNSADDRTVSGSHSNMGVMLAALGRDKEALAEYGLAEELARKSGDEEQLMHVLSNRSSLYRTRGHPEQALAEIRPVAAYYEKSPVRLDALRTLGEYAQTLLEAGDPRAAIEVGERNLPEARSTRGTDLLGFTLGPLGEAYLKVDEREKARAAFLEAIANIESVKLTGGEDERDNFFHRKAYPYQGMVTLLIGEQPFEALQYAERAKARLLLDVLRGGRNEIARAMTKEERQRERDLVSALAKMDTRLAREGAKAPRELLVDRDHAALDLENFRRALYEAHPGLQVQRAELSPVTAVQLSMLVPDSSTILLEYVVTKTAVHLFAIARGPDADPVVKTFTLGTADGLAATVEQFRAQLAARDLGYRATAKSLYAKLVGPAAPLLAARKRIVIAPDGPLWNLPFQALMAPDGKHLLEQAAVFYVPSLTAAYEMHNLKRGKSADAGEGEGALLAFGGPVAQPGGLPPLPESIREVRQIGALYDGKASEILIGERGQKDTWKAAAPGFRILHLATHGVLNANNPLYSYLVMSAPPGAKDESVLTAREILALDLHSDLAVLSACETARGRVSSGEGLIGMSWAFLVAGSPTTVVSQWKVDSASTSQLMVAFHRNLKAAGSVPLTGRAEALRSAVLELMRTPAFSHPFYWAGFVMIGDGY
jgi:CHAT domain-containing protein